MGHKISIYSYSENQPIFEKMKLALLLICIVVGAMKLSSANPLVVGSGVINEERIADEHKGWNGINGKYSGERIQRRFSCDFTNRFCGKRGENMMQNGPGAEQKRQNMMQNGKRGDTIYKECNSRRC